MKEYSEKTKRLRLKGTILDIETVGEFEQRFPSWDERYYTNLQPTILGYLTDDVLVQHCAEGFDEIGKLIEEMLDTIPKLESPVFALNSRFERHILKKSCNLEPLIVDVRGIVPGSKWKLREKLGIPTYDDPFNGVGRKCAIEWLNGEYEKCMKHNRACLQIERDILEKLRRLP